MKKLIFLNMQYKNILNNINNMKKKKKKKRKI